MRVGSLFSGIGGLDLGLERAGMEIVWQCEIDPFCRAVLTKHWPGVHIYEDVRDIDANAEQVDLICGGFPCQPVSVSGKRRGEEDERWLWPEFRRVVDELRPEWVVIENVRGLATRGLQEIVEELEAFDYEATAYLVPACQVGATHTRERVFVIADALSQSSGLAQFADRGQAWELPGASAPALVRRRDGALGAEGRPSRLEFPRWGSVCGWDAPEPLIRRVDDGFSRRVDRVRALGNAVVPQVAEYVGRLIMEADAQ